MCCLRGKRRMIVLDRLLPIDLLPIDLLNGNDWPWMGNVVWFVDGGIWGMEDRRIGRIENGGNLKLKQIRIHIKHYKYQQS